VRAKEYKKKRKKLSEERFGLGKSENFFSVQKARTSVMRNVVARPFSKTKSITLADFFAFCFLLLSLSLFPRVFVFFFRRLALSHLTTLSLSLPFSLFFLRKARRNDNDVRARRRKK